MVGAGQREFRETIQHHSKSFSFASTLLPARSRRDVEVLYTWCRRTDDAIDLAPSDRRADELERLRVELDAIYGEPPVDDDLGAAMQALVRVHAIPRLYLDELLEGMAMDVRRVDYEVLDTLLQYCYRVAGTVGLMMSHVIGVRDPSALQPAVHLGIAMQLTNICRDVREDWDNGRLYLPHDVLARHDAGSLPARLGQPLPVEFRDAIGRSVGDLLAIADDYYASADRGFVDLPWRAALAVRTARMVYADIGSEIRRSGCDVFAGRAYVPSRRKYALGLRALTASAAEVPYRARHRFSRAVLSRPLEFPDDVVHP
jgi:15-cis-phytoene synthase